MPPSSDISRSTALLSLGAIMVLSVVLSFFFIGNSLRLDESQSLWQISRTPTEILTEVAQDVHVPLYHEVLRVWQAATGDTVAGARLLSRLFYLLGIPALYVLGTYLYNRRAGLFAALLFALSPFMNWYGDETRMYTLFALLAILNQYYFMKLFREGRSGFAYGLTALLGCFSHYLFFVLLFVQFVFCVVRRPLFPDGTLRKLALSWGVVAIAFAPWAYYVFALGQVANSQPVLATPTSVDLFSTLSQFFFGFQSDAVNTLVLSLWPVLIIFAFLALRHTRRMRPETEYLLLSAFLPVLLVFLISVLVTPLFVSRYLIFTIPAFYLLIADLIALYPRSLRIFGRTAIVLVMLLMLAIEIVSPTSPVKENYRGASQYLTAHAAAQDVVVLAAPFTLYPVEYYYRGEASVATLPKWDQYAHGAIPAYNANNLPKEVADIAGAHQNVWLLLSYDQGYNTEIKTYFDTHYARIYTANFSPGLDLYEYQLRYDTPVAKLGGVGMVASSTSQG